jgi:hypothetical protein
MGDLQPNNEAGCTGAHFLDEVCINESSEVSELSTFVKLRAFLILSNPLTDEP